MHFALKLFREVRLIFVIQPFGYLDNGQIRFEKKFTGLLDPHIGDDLLGGFAGISLEDPVYLRGAETQVVGQQFYGNLIPDISADIDHCVFEAVEGGNLGMEILHFLILFDQFSHKLVEVTFDVGHIPAGSGLVIDVSDTILQKIILVIMEEQMMLIQAGLPEQRVRFFAKESDPADIPGVLFVGGMHDRTAGRDQKAIIFFQMVGVIMGLIDALSFGDIVDQIVIPDILAIAVIGFCRTKSGVKDDNVTVNIGFLGI